MNDQDYPPNGGQKSEDDEEPVDLTEEARARDGDPDADAPADEEIAVLNDRILRLAAELENTRRRGEREKAEAGQFAIANFARELIGVADNFERALAAAGEDQSASSPEALSGLVDGLRMTEKELLTALERHGVRRIYPAGEKFDPHLHQAVAQVPSATTPSGHVADVVQSGFMIGRRVLRAAMVTVSSGAAATGGNDSEPGMQVDTQA